MAIRLTLLGRFALTVGGAEIAGLPRKVQALIAYLALREGRTATREAVAELLWPERGSEQSRQSLRQALLMLRSLTRDIPIITSSQGRLTLDPPVYDCDLDRLRQACAAPGAAPSIASLYPSPLLEGFLPVSADFDIWLLATRETVQAQALKQLEQAVRLALAADNSARAVETAERMAVIEPLREDIHRLLMTAYQAAGRRSDALRHFDQVKQMLRRELGVAPAAETAALAQHLRSADGPAPVPGPPPPQPRGAPPCLAVLPLQSFGDAPIATHLRDGIVADVIGQLAGLREFSVISHGSTLRLRDASADVRDIGQQLSAQYVVRGAVQSSTSGARLVVELVECSSRIVVWAHQSEIGYRPSFADQDRLVSQIVNSLAPRVHATELRRIRGKRPELLSVYEKVLLVREHLMVLQRDGFLEARRLLDEIIAEDPHYAEAYALSADWHNLFVSQGWALQREPHLSEVDRLARTALTLDRLNLRALTFYAHRRSLLHRDYGAACRLFARALEAAPSAVKAWLWSSYTYSYVGDYAEALRRAEKALSLSPCDREAHEFYTAFAVAHYVAGDFAEAAAWGQRALGETSVLRATYGWTAAALAATGRLHEARDVAMQGMREMPNRRVRDVVQHHPFREPARREAYGAHLLAAGFPP